MHLATIRVRDTEILSLSCRRLDAEKGSAILELVTAAAHRGCTSVVLDFGPVTVIDFAGARALEAASAVLRGRGRLFLSGLSGRARATLRALRAEEHVQMIEWWTEAVAPEVRAA